MRERERERAVSTEGGKRKGPCISSEDRQEEEEEEEGPPFVLLPAHKGSHSRSTKLMQLPIPPFFFPVMPRAHILHERRGPSTTKLHAEGPSSGLLRPF